MKRTRILWLLPVLLVLLSCARSVKSEKQEKTAAAGEVESLDKAAFLKKVYNYEKNPETWVYEGDKPCIIDFYADWCGPCKKVAPILEEMAEKYKDRIVVYKIDVDKETDLAKTFGITSIPTILFVPMKGKPQLVQGAMPRAEVIKQIDTYLLNKK